MTPRPLSPAGRRVARYFVAGLTGDQAAVDRLQEEWNAVARATGSRPVRVPPLSRPTTDPDPLLVAIAGDVAEALGLEPEGGEEYVA